MRKSQTTAFLLLLFYIGKKDLYRKTYLKKLSLYCYIRTAVFHVAGYWRCSNTNANMDIHWYCRRHNSIQNTWQQTKYFNVDFDSNGLFLLFIYFRKCLQFRKKSILIWAINFIVKSIRKGIEILAKRLFSFSIIVFSMKLLVIIFIRKKKHLLGNILVHPIQVTGSTYCRIVFQTMYTSKICTQP